MLRYFVVAVMSLGSVAFSSRCSAKELVPIESAKAEKVVVSAKERKTNAPGYVANIARVRRVQLSMPNMAVGQAGLLVDKQGYIGVFDVVSVVNGSNLIVHYYNDRSYEEHYLWLKGFSRLSPA